MRQRRGPVEYFDDRGLWRGFNAAFDVALSHELRTDYFAPSKPIPVVCIDSPGTKRPEGGVHIPDSHEAALTLSFIDPLTRTLDRREISRTFLEKGPVQHIKNKWRTAIRTHRSSLSLQPEQAIDCLFIPFQIKDRLISQAPYRETAVPDLAAAYNDLSDIDENDPRLITKMREFHRIWFNSHPTKQRPHLSREVQALTEAFNRRAAHFLMMCGRPVLVERAGQKDKPQYTLAKNLSDLDGHLGRFTATTRHPVAFLNAVQLSLAIQDVQQDVFEEFGGPTVIYPKNSGDTEVIINSPSLHPKLSAVQALLMQAPTQDLFTRLNEDPSQFFKVIAVLIMTSPETTEWTEVKVKVLRLLGENDAKALYLECVPYDSKLADIRFHSTRKNSTHVVPVHVVIKDDESYLLYRKDVATKFFAKNRHQQNEKRAIGIAFIHFLISRIKPSGAMKTMTPLGLANVLARLRCIQKWRHRPSES